LINSVDLALLCDGCDNDPHYNLLRRTDTIVSLSSAYVYVRDRVGNSSDHRPSRRDAFTSMPSQTPHFLKAADFPDDELEASVCTDYMRTICDACRIRTFHNPRYYRPVENGVSVLRASWPPPQQHPRYVYWSAAYIWSLRRRPYSLSAHFLAQYIE
jgi:hypothetical protein